MPEIFPFRAHRYAFTGARLARAVCPPYDVIPEKLLRRLRANKENAIGVELPWGQDGQKYENAAKTWSDWRERGLVLQDPEPAFYVYEQVFKVRGKKISRKGFFCELKVEEPGKGSVLRHELTLAGPKADRLDLLRKVRINTSPIFGLLPDPKKTVRKRIASVARGKPAEQIRDSEGVLHRLWIMKDGSSIEEVRRAALQNPVLIADGHHRYETSWNYAQERRQAEGADSPSSRTLFFICPLEDPGLVVLPTHRVLKERKMEELLDRVLMRKNVFSVKPEKKPSAPRRPGFTLTDGKRSFFVSLRDLAGARQILGSEPEAYLSLPLVHIHRLFLPELRKEDFLYTPDEKEALALARKLKSTAILVPPTTVKELNSIVRSGELMPQKSTYFYPKIITGMVFRSL